MSGSEHIAQFVNVTGSTPEQATQFLGAANGDLGLALSSYFEVQAGQQEGLDDPADDYTGPRTLDGTPAGPSKSNHPPSSASRGQPPRRTGIATLGSGGASAGGFRQGDSDSEKDNHTDDDHDPDLYAGGGRSGLNIEDPNKRKGGRKLVENILKKAAENGPIEQQTPSQSGPSWFGGSGNTLGSDETPSQFIPSAQSGDAEDLDEEEKVTRHLTLWANGFSVDDGPLLSYQEHQSILQDLSAGRAPLHLLNVKFGQRVDLQVQKRTDEEYVAPKPTVKPFGGEGNRLGAPTPQASTSSASSSQPPAADRDTFMTHTKFELDHSQPITSIQIRLGTGERMVGRFNHTHTVGDVMSYIDASHPGTSARPYVLQTTFPNRDLTDKSQTVKDAGLLSSVVVCKYV